MSRQKTCVDCRRHLPNYRFAPMLRRVTWRKLAHDPELLCWECVLDRAQSRGIELSVADLVPGSFCLLRWPNSYFNVMSQGGGVWPYRQEWREVAWRQQNQLKGRAGVGGAWYGAIYKATRGEIVDFSNKTGPKRRGAVAASYLQYWRFCRE